MATDGKGSAAKGSEKSEAKASSAKKGSAQAPATGYRAARRHNKYAYPLRRYPQVVRTFFTQADGLPSDEITSMAASKDGSVWAGTAAGLARWTGQGWESQGVDAGLPGGKVTLVYADRQGRVWASFPGGLYRFENGAWRKDWDDEVVAMTEDESDRLFAATASQSLTLLSDGRWQEIAANRRFQVRGMAAYGHGNVLLATDHGLMVLYGKRRDWAEGRVSGPTRDGWKPVRKESSRAASNDLRSIIADRWGHVWIATERGVSIYDDASNWYHLDGSGGLPHEDVRVIAEGPDGEKWFGTTGGAARLKDGQWKFYGAKRWLPDNSVRAIAIGPDGTVWIGTASGVSRLVTRFMTLEEKAAHYDAMVQKYHVRKGYVTVRILEEEGNIEKGFVEISDNDGMWTALYVVSQVYRYAVTGDELAREQARTHMKALLLLAEVSGHKGFPARAIRHKTEPQFGNGHPEWHPTPDGEWEWKGDTSSDEMVGHFYAYGLYYDLVADEEEKEHIRRVVRDIMDHVIAHDYNLVDVDGKPTTWAVWEPRKLNLEDRWWPEKANNSLEILSFLKSAAHITGEARYEEAYRDLVAQHHYAMNTIQSPLNTGGRLSHIDDELSFFSMFPLLTYESDPHLRQIYMIALERHWQFERPERSPLWNAIYGAVTGHPWDAEEAVQSLAEMPLDLIHWQTQNSHRADIELEAELAAQGIKQPKEALPFDERPLHKWDGQAYALDGGNGRRVEDGTVYLHPYWLARYWGLIEERD